MHHVTRVILPESRLLSVCSGKGADPHRPTPCLGGKSDERPVANRGPAQTGTSFPNKLSDSETLITDTLQHLKVWLCPLSAERLAQLFPYFHVFSCSPVSSSCKKKLSGSQSQPTLLGIPGWELREQRRFTGAGSSRREAAGKAEARAPPRSAQRW